ncbi:MAG: co-chaperone GroES [Bryobacteraceae bacterium]
MTPQHGEVIAVAKGVHLEDESVNPAALKIGDRILFREYSGDEIRLSGETYLMMRRDEIIRVLADAAESDEEAAN